MRFLHAFIVISWCFLAASVWFTDYEPSRWFVGLAFGLLAGWHTAELLDQRDWS